MAKIALCILVGTEGFGNVSVDKEVGCLENMLLDQNMLVQRKNSLAHEPLLTREDACLVSFSRAARNNTTR